MPIGHDAPTVDVMQDPVDNTRDAPTVHDLRQKRLILLATCTALIAVIASVTGLNVAQQELALDLGASQSTVLWMINAYTLAPCRPELLGSRRRRRS